MTDDWSEPTGERRRFRNRATMEPPDDDACVDPVLGISERDLRLVDGFYHNLGVQASEAPSPPTPDEEGSIEWLGERFEELKAMSTDELLALRAERSRRA